jgi:hypothetical protein
VANKSNSIAF